MIAKIENQRGQAGLFNFGNHQFWQSPISLISLLARKISANGSIKDSVRMKILFIGDIFGSPGRKIVNDHLRHVAATHQADLIVANAENAAGGVGLTPAIADELFDLGCDVLTTGNHVWDKREIMDYLSSANGHPGSRPARVLRPANYS